MQMASVLLSVAALPAPSFARGARRPNRKLRLDAPGTRLLPAPQRPPFRHQAATQYGHTCELLGRRVTRMSGMRLPTADFKALQEAPPFIAGHPTTATR